MHHSTDTDIIKMELENLGYTVLNIINMRQRITKKSLPLFSVDLKLDENNKSILLNIYTVKYLLNTKIKFEARHFKRDIPMHKLLTIWTHKKFLLPSPTLC